MKISKKILAAAMAASLAVLTLAGCGSGSSTGSGGAHTHTTSSWMPKVKDRVVCLMMCGTETDGYILGAIP